MKFPTYVLPKQSSEQKMQAINNVKMPRSKMQFQVMLHDMYTIGFKEGFDHAVKEITKLNESSRTEAQVKLINAAGQAYEAIARTIMASENY